MVLSSEVPHLLLPPACCGFRLLQARPAHCGIRYGAVHLTAGDVNSVTIGHNCNIQDNVVVHVARHSLREPRPTVIGNNVTIGTSSALSTAPVRLLSLQMRSPVVKMCSNSESGSVCAGHGACIHACTIEDDVLIGMGALVLDGAKVRCSAMCCRSFSTSPALARHKNHRCFGPC